MVMIRYRDVRGRLIVINPQYVTCVVAKGDDASIIHLANGDVHSLEVPSSAEEVANHLDDALNLGRGRS